MLRRLFPTRSPHAKSIITRSCLLGFEALEAREVPSVTLADISQPQIPSNKPIFIPVTVTNTPNGPVSVAVTSSDPTDVSAQVVQGGQSVRFDVSGTDSNGVPFSGSITIRLFTNAAPDAVQRIIDLVNSGYYNGKDFPRILNNFVIQGGGTSTSDNSPLPSFNDEFNADYTFASPGIVAMANSGDDTNNSQFFIADPKVPLVAATSGGPSRPQFLNFNYTIVGILTGGFDLYQKIITTPVSDNGSGEVSKPNSTVVITGATVFTDTSNAVIELTPLNKNFTGSANISVTATDTDGAAGAATKSFAVQGVNDGVDSPPFITTPVPDQTTTAGAPVTFTVPTTDINGDPVTIAVKDTTFATAPPNVTVSIDQTTGKVTITPNAGFTGTVQFKVGVRETSATDTASNYDTQLVTLTVTAANTPVTPTNPTTGPFTATGSAPGTPAMVTVLNSDGSTRFSVPVFGGFTGGIRVATGDVNDDGVSDIVVVPGFGGAGLIDVLSSVDGSIIRTAHVFENSFRGGLNVQVGDAQGLGYDQVLVGAGDSGGPRATLLDFKTGKELLNFFAGDSTLRGGVDVDVSDVFSGKGQMIVTSMGPGAGPTVSLFNASTSAIVGTFLAGDINNRDGIDVQVGNRPSSTAARTIEVTPFGSPAGATGPSFDPSKFINPDAPASTSSSSNIDINSLLNGSSG
ncbi:MAG TPA: peptidylprolyl isomerase [Urbifossiella sp.]|nr:peptidylprolyl isomerase [Urbifossiella sp.]